MPNKKSAQKELRKSLKRKEHNFEVKEDLKILIKKSKKAIEAKGAEAQELVKSALKALDKAAQKGIIKKNTRNRKKSRLTLKLNKITKK